MWEASVFSRKRSCCRAVWYRVQLSQPKTEHHMLWEMHHLFDVTRGWLSRTWANSVWLALISLISLSEVRWSGLGVQILVWLLSLGVAWQPITLCDCSWKLLIVSGSSFGKWKPQSSITSKKWEEASAGHWKPCPCFSYKLWMAALFFSILFWAL